MRTWLLAGNLAFLSCSAFLETNPQYCDESIACSVGGMRCDLLHHACVPNVPGGPPPSLTAISPTTARTTGGTAMTLSGTDFRAGMQVIVNGDTQHPITPTAIFATTLQFTLPALPGSCGMVPVTLLDETGQAAPSQALLRVKYGRLQLSTMNEILVATANSVTMGDLDGDQNLDLLLTYEIGRPLSYYRGDGRLALGVPRQRFGNMDANYDRAVIVDIKGAGIPNIVGRTTSAITVYEGPAGQSFSQAVDVPVSNNDFLFADVNADGRLDLIVSEAAPSHQVIYYQFTEGTYYGLSTGLGVIDGTPTALAAADWNGDQRVDLVVGSPVDKAAFYFRGLGASTFDIAKSFPVGGDPSLPILLAQTDVEKDNKPELLIGTSSGSTSQLLLARPVDDSFQTTTLGPIATGLERMLLADFDCDGLDDIVLYHNSAKALQVYLNNGAGGFEDKPIEVSMGNSAASLAIGNMNSQLDTKPDVVILSSGSADRTMTVFRNTSD